jgi:hypothetical protein
MNSKFSQAHLGSNIISIPEKLTNIVSPSKENSGWSLFVINYIQ